MGPRQTITDMLAQARAPMDRLEPSAALSAMQQGALLIDTRCTEQRRETGIIPGSVHVPLSVLYWRLDPASGHEDKSLADPATGHPRLRPRLLVEHRGGDAARPRICAASDMDGGFEAWQAAGLPIEVAAD